MSEDDDRDELSIRAEPDAVSFEVRITPRASREAITGVRAGALRVSVTAAPVDGAANEALIALLADALGVPKRAVRITRGERGRTKSIRVEGLDPARVRDVLRRV